MVCKIRRAVAVMLCLTMAVAFAACGGGSAGESGINEDDMSKEVTLKWYIRSAEPSGSAEVIEAFNKYSKEKLNASVDIVFVPPDDYDQKLRMAVAANEKIDLVWTSYWANPYQNNVMRGSFLELDELLEAVPALRSFYPDSVWDAARIDGKIYGVPNNQVLYDHKGINFVKSYVDKYNLEVGGLTCLEDLTPLFQTIKNNEPNVTPAWEGYSSNFLKPITEVSAPFLINASGMVTDRRKELRPAYDIIRDWYLCNFFPADVTTMTDETTLLKEGKLFSSYSRQFPGVNEKAKIRYGYDFISVATSDPLLSRSSVQNAMTAVSAHSENPIRALKLIELMQTDKYACNLLFYGLEGRDFQMDPDNDSRIIHNSDSYYLAEFLTGNQFLGYILPEYPLDIWERADKANKEAPVDPNIGFSFDPSSVENEITQIAVVGKEFDTILNNGLEAPELSVSAYYDKLEKAGRQKVMNEIQKQFNEWKAAQK